MTTTDEASFTLSRFEWTPPNRLDVVGSWSGMDRSDVSAPTLILHAPGSTHSLEAVGNVAGNMRNWSAVFPWEGDPAAVERAELVVGGRLVVELPAPDKQRRRFGRVALAVRALEHEREAARGTTEDADVLSMHAAMLAAQEELAETLVEVARLRSERERSREELMRESRRRETDVGRLQEAMTTLRRLAQESLEKEREATRSACVQLDEAEASASEAKAEAIHLEEQGQAALAERDRLTEQARRQQAESERLRTRLDLLARETKEQSERSKAELDGVQAQRRQEAQEATVEARKLKSAHEEAREEAATANAKLASIASELEQARSAREESEHLRNEIASAQQDIERAKAESERLRTKLNALRQVFEEGG